MSYANRVKLKNPITFEIIKNAFANNRVSHAYLFSAPPQVSADDEALFLIQSLISPEEFPNFSGNILTYADLITIDGSKSQIKKVDLSQALYRLQQTPLDKKGLKILLIKNIENGNRFSLNALLKFLEEPTQKTYIVMTTNSLAKVLSTIRSRAQIMTLRAPSQTKITELLVNESVSLEHATIVSSFAPSLEDALPLLDSDYFVLYEQIVDIMKRALVNSSVVLTDFSKLIKQSNHKLITNMLNVFINDIWKSQNNLPISFLSQKTIVEKYLNFDYERALIALENFRISQKSYVNFPLSKIALLIKLKRSYG